MAERIAKAFAGFDRARIERQFPAEWDWNAYGVAKPQMIVLVYRPNDPQPLAQYAVGDIAPDTLSRYVMVIGSSGDIDHCELSDRQFDRLDRDGERPARPELKHSRNRPDPGR